jgi:hypothetical protein
MIWKYRSTSRLVAFGNTFFPFENPDALEWFFQGLAELQLATVVHTGNLLTAVERFGSPKDIKERRSRAEAMWVRVGQIVPSARKIQLLGVEDLRLLRQALPSNRAFHALEEPLLRKALFGFDGVETPDQDYRPIEVNSPLGTVAVFPDQPGLISRDACFHLGPAIVGGRTGKICKERTLPGCVYVQDVGMMAKLNAPIFDYRQRHKWAIGFAAVLENGPVFHEYEFAQRLRPAALRALSEGRKICASLPTNAPELVHGQAA